MVRVPLPTAVTTQRRAAAQNAFRCLGVQNLCGDPPVGRGVKAAPHHRHTGEVVIMARPISALHLNSRHGWTALTPDHAASPQAMRTRLSAPTVAAAVPKRPR